MVGDADRPGVGVITAESQELVLLPRRELVQPQLLTGAKFLVASVDIPRADPSCGIKIIGIGVLSQFRDALSLSVTGPNLG